MISPRVSRGRDKHLMRCSPSCGTSHAPWDWVRKGMKGSLGVPREMESMAVGAWRLIPSPLSAPWPQPSTSAEVPPWYWQERGTLVSVPVLKNAR